MKIVTLAKKQLADSKRRMGESVLSVGEMLAQGLQVMVPGVGAGISLALGKLVLGGVLAAICLSVIVRLTLRRKNVGEYPTQRASSFQKLVAFVLALGFGAAFVEMTNLPVRFNQTGFSFWYWFIVAAVILVTYQGTLQIFSKMFPKKAKTEKALRLG
jgi:cytochrome bd-type quinol oxidase subunit 2